MWCAPRLIACTSALPFAKRFALSSARSLFSASLTHGGRGAEAAAGREGSASLCSGLQPHVLLSARTARGRPHVPRADGLEAPGAQARPAGPRGALAFPPPPPARHCAAPAVTSAARRGGRGRLRSPSVTRTDGRRCQVLRGGTGAGNGPRPPRWAGPGGWAAAACGGRGQRLVPARGAGPRWAWLFRPGAEQALLWARSRAAPPPPPHTHLHIDV